nr:hypothetical protein [Tanacetum cinerariifolium]
MITVNNQRDSVSPHPLVAKPKKGKSQTVAPTLPKSQGLEASGALSKKRTKPKYKNHPLRPKNHHPSQRRVLSNPTQSPQAHVRAILLSEDEAQEVDEEVLAAEDDMDKDPHDDKEVRTPSLKQDQPAPSHVQESASDSSILASKDLTIFFLSLKEEIVLYADLKALVDQYYEENIAHEDQSEKLVEASMSSLDRSSTTISDLYKGLNFITQLFKEISNTIKDDPAINQKINEATETFARISSYVTEMSGVELSQTALKREISSLRQDTSKIKFMMTEIYAAFQGRPSLAPSGSVTPTLALTDIQANVERENATTTTIEEPSSYTKGETEEPRLAIRISSIPSTVIPPTQPTSSILKALKQL